MLNGDSNENGKKTIGLIGKNNFARTAHISLPLLCTTRT